jgi:hypothetical protein
LIRYALRAPDVAGLGGLISSGQHHDHDRLPSRKIKTIAGTETYPHLRNVTTHRFSVSEIPSLSKAQARRYAGLRPDVPKIIQPIPKLFRQANGEHEDIVSEWILASIAQLKMVA